MNTSHKKGDGSSVPMYNSVIVVLKNGDSTILDYYSDGEIYSDGTYSLAVAKHIRPGAEIREESNRVRCKYSRPTADMMDRAVQP